MTAIASGIFAACCSICCVMHDAGVNWRYLEALSDCVFMPTFPCPRSQHPAALPLVMPSKSYPPGSTVRQGGHEDRADVVENVMGVVMRPLTTAGASAGKLTARYDRPMDHAQ